MGFYWIEFTLIWIILHQGGLTSSASLRSESLDISPDGIDITKSPTEQNLPIRESNYYHKNNENTKHRTRFPYERRNRQIYTSKTFFGRSQLLELPRKYSENKADKETAPLRMKTARYMYPENHRKLAPHKSDITAANEHVISHLGHQISTAPEHNAGHDAIEVLGPNPNYDQNLGYEPFPHPEQNVNAGYGQDLGYDDNTGYTLNSNAHAGHRQAPGYDPNVRHGQVPVYDPNVRRGQVPVYDPNVRRGQVPVYDPNVRHGQVPVYDPNVRHGQVLGYDPNVRPGQVSGFDTNAVNRQHLGYDANAGNGQDHGYNANSGHRQNHGDPTNVEFGHDSRRNVFVGYGSDVRENVNAEYDPKIGYGGNTDGFGPTHHQSKKDIKSEKDYLKSEELKQDDMKDVLQKLEEKETSEHKLEDKESKKGKGEQTDILNNDDQIKIINLYNQLLQSEKYPDSRLNKNSETSVVSNSDLISDENLENDELLRHLPEENVFKQMSSDTVTDVTNSTFPDFSLDGIGSGDREGFNEHLPTLDQESNKSARILEIFSRENDSNQCITPKNESGQCRGLTECPLIETMENFSSFLQYMCFQKGRLVGICCPDNPVIEISDPVDKNSTEQVKADIQQPPEGCGLSTNTRIVGGTMSIPHEFSWMVALLRRDRFYCGGVIINNWYILTAAHCVLGIKISDLKVRLGEFDFHKTTNQQRDIPVAEIKRHALFVTLTFQHDIAVLKLKRRIEYTKFVGSICLPNKAEGDFTARNATVVGWGTISFGGSASPILRKVTVPVWDNKQCDQTYVFERINDAFMCAGSPENGEDACQGDSGGPLMTMSDDGRWSVIGIVSWGRRCGDPTYPGVYTRVTSYLDWIAEHAQ